MFIKSKSDYRGRMTSVAVEMSREELKSLAWVVEEAREGNAHPKDGATRLAAGLIALRDDLANEEF